MEVPYQDSATGASGTARSWAAQQSEAGVKAAGRAMRRAGHLLVLDAGRDGEEGELALAGRAQLVQRRALLVKGEADDALDRRRVGVLLQVLQVVHGEGAVCGGPGVTLGGFHGAAPHAPHSTKSLPMSPTAWIWSTRFLPTRWVRIASCRMRPVAWSSMTRNFMTRPLPRPPNTKKLSPFPGSAERRGGAARRQHGPRLSHCPSRGDDSGAQRANPSTWRTRSPSQKR